MTIDAHDALLLRYQRFHIATGPVSARAASAAVAHTLRGGHAAELINDHGPGACSFAFSVIGDGVPPLTGEAHERRRHSSTNRRNTPTA